MKMDNLDISTHEHNEFIPRVTLLSAVTSPDIKQSPNASKSGSKKAQQKKQQQEPQRPATPLTKVPESAYHPYGTTNAILHFLEVKSLSKN